jgi:hypothetical protein
MPSNNIEELCTLGLRFEALMPEVHRQFILLQCEIQSKEYPHRGWIMRRGDLAVPTRCAAPKEGEAADASSYELRPVVVRHQIRTFPRLTIRIRVLPCEKAVVGMFKDRDPG